LVVAAEVEVEPQKKIYDEWGRFVARADLWVVGTRRIHEYDGEVHRDREVHRTDLARERRLVEIDWQRVGFTSPQLVCEGGIDHRWRGSAAASNLEPAAPGAMGGPARSSDRVDAPEQCANGGALAEALGKVLANHRFHRSRDAIFQHFRGSTGCQTT
jgi:hypothetical protein